MISNNTIFEEKNFNYNQQDDSSFPTPKNWTTKGPYDGCMFITPSDLDRLIEEKVGLKIEEILKEKESIKFREVDIKTARKEIKDFIREQHKSGLFNVSILDIVLSLKLPAYQVDKIMSGFEKDGKIKEVYE